MDDAAPRAATSAPTTDETLVAAALRKSVSDREPSLDVEQLAPDYVMLNDPFVIKNIFPEHAAKRAAELGVTFPE